MSLGVSTSSWGSLRAFYILFLPNMNQSLQRSPVHGLLRLRPPCLQGRPGSFLQPFVMWPSALWCPHTVRGSHFHLHTLQPPTSRLINFSVSSWFECVHLTPWYKSDINQCQVDFSPLSLRLSRTQAFVWFRFFPTYFRQFDFPGYLIIIRWCCQVNLYFSQIIFRAQETKVMVHINGRGI